jgi:type IV pilus assembly protein PilY1
MTGLSHPTKKLLVHLMVAFSCLMVSISANAQSGDDIFLLQSAVAPNVVLFMDNSDSMNHIEWHPAFDPEKVPDASYCTSSADFGGALDPNIDYSIGATVSTANCDTPARGNRKVYGVRNPLPTYWSGRYLTWYLGLDETDFFNDTATTEIYTAVANVAGCTQAGSSKFFAEKYRRTRFEASKQVLLDLLCVAETKNVRFAQAEFRVPADAGLIDPNGGFVGSDLGRSNPNHAAELESAIKNSLTTPTDGIFNDTATTEIYTYWMPRVAADMPLGENGAAFPIYEYNKFGARVGSASWFEDAMLYDCEKAFVIIVTDGLPSRDNFEDDPADTALGFVDFASPPGPIGLIDDYHVDGEIEDPGAANGATYYLDDIAKYMYDKDFRPDLAGNQTIDTYTIGFATDTVTDDYLERTAVLGNGTFYKVVDGDELTLALIAALNDIIEKSASFTAATVPSARTKDGADFYQSFFFPRGRSAFWEGHIRAWTIDAAGAIKGNESPVPLCALDDPTPGECNSGPFRPDAVYFWDAAEEIPLPASRNLYVSDSGATNGSVPPAFNQTNITYQELGLDAFAAAPDPAPNSPLYGIVGSTAINEMGLAAEIVEHARGCFFGTGVLANVATPVGCAERPARLGDIFHSNAVAVRQPLLKISNPGYISFKNFYAARDRVLYAGTNAGFLEAFNTGSWVVPGHHYVDGDVNSADVWIDDELPGNVGYNEDPSNGSEWHTYLVGALREGGNHYYALDVTNPNQVSPPLDGGNDDYPRYAWEFPSESNVADQAFMGESWSTPIITKVRLKRTDLPGQTVDRWVAIVTGGYDATSDPNPDAVTTTVSSYSAVSVKGRGIYIIDLKTGNVLAEKKFGSVADNQASMLYSVVSTPSVLDINFDGVADVIYVGDMGGNLWKWAIHDPGEDRIHDGSGLRTQPSWPFKAFFTAAPATIGGGAGAVTYYKNFMFPPAAAYSNGTLFLAFGSGERRNLQFEGDPDATELGENNRIYVMIDSDPYETASPAFATLTEADLTDFSASAAAQTFANKGFFIRVADGEKFVTNIEIFSGEVIAATFTPTSGVNPCLARGVGELYVFDLETGAGHFTDGAGNPDRSLSLGPGLPTDPKVSIGVGGKDNRIVIEKSGSDIEIIEAPNVNLNGATLYWREND